MKNNYRLNKIFAIPVSHSDLLKHWRATHTLEGVRPFLSVILICSNTGEQLTNWRGVQPFLSVVLICSNTGEGPTRWRGVQPFLPVVLICPNTGEQLTCWRVFSPSQWFWSAQTLESNSHPGEVFSPSCQWFWSAQTQGLTNWRGVQPLSVVLICSNTGEPLTRWRGV